MPSALPQFCIDGQWTPSQRAEGFGSLGVRYLCELGSRDGQPAKRLLIRPHAWPQAKGAGRDTPAKLVIAKRPDGKSLNLRPVMPNKYQQATARAEGSPQLDICPVLQQDVTGLVSLKQAILRAIKSNQPQQIWELFYYACKALDEFGRAVGRDRPVPLQCPDSLAVDARNRIVLLDAEILVSGSVPADSEAGRMYQEWFGEEGRGGFADVEQASVLHANALVLYFRRLLGAWQQQTNGTERQLPPTLVAPLERVRPGTSLDDFENWIRQSAEDWNIYIEDEAEEPAGVALSPEAESAPEGSPRASSREKSSRLLLASMCLNLALIAALVLLLLLWPRGSRAVAPSKLIDSKDVEAAGPGDSDLFFSSYCVVFPTQGTIGEKVGAALQDLFPDQFREIRRNEPNHEKLLQDKMAEVIKSLGESQKLKELLVKLTAERSIRFKGFAASEPDAGLVAIIERGGIFTLVGPGGERHGSLLQNTGVDKALKHAEMHDQAEARELLAGLRKAIAEYASLKDALSIIGDRTAFLLHVEPTAVGHERARRKLLSRLEKPVFVSRPIPEFFDAVDPSADTAGSVASYSLRLDRKCFWRLASQEDRRNVDYQNNTSNDRMKWRSFDAGQLITWRPIPLTRLNGKTDAVASFDIGVVLGGKVVIFRNQSLLVGDSRNQVLTQGRNYIERALKLRVGSIEDAISVRQQEGQYTGTLLYSFLADQVTDDAGADLQIMSNKKFEDLKTQEDNVGS